MYQNFVKKEPDGLPASIMISSDLELVTEKPVNANAPKDEEDGEPPLRSLGPVLPIFSFTSQPAIRCQKCGKEFQSEEAKAAHQRVKGH